MTKFDRFMVAGILFIILFSAGVIILGQPNCDERIYTEDWSEARQFARQCDGTVTMIPHWNKGEDRPYAATVICRR